MSNKAIVKKIMEHPDREEILSKMLIEIDCKDINEWLDAKYQAANEKKFILSEKQLKAFKEDYLDIYTLVQEDLIKTKTNLATDNSIDDLNLSVQSLPAYKAIMLKTANEELDIRKTIKALCGAIENRVMQIYDQIQSDPESVNSRTERLWLEYTDRLQNVLEKYYKFTEEPQAQTINHNVNVMVDQHITVFYDVIKELLAGMDLEKSMQFMEIFNNKMSKLKMPEKDAIQSSSIRLGEAKLLNETITKKLEQNE